MWNRILSAKIDFLADRPAGSAEWDRFLKFHLAKLGPAQREPPPIARTSIRVTPYYSVGDPMARTIPASSELGPIPLRKSRAPWQAALLLALLASLVVAILVPSRLTAQLAGVERTILATAVDRDGAPVAGLTAADFTVREGGRARTVVSAAPSTRPLFVVLMIDDSGLGLQSMREGAAAFIELLRDQAAVAIVTTGGRNIKLTDFTNSRATLMAAINKVYARNVTGSFLTDGIVEVAREFIEREAIRTAIVSMGVEGQDFSDVRPDEVFRTIQQSATRLYMVRLGQPLIGRSNALDDLRGESFADESTRFNAILGQAPPRSGGRIEQLASHTGIPRVMQSFAAELIGQYEVTYASPDSSPVDVRLEVGTTRPGLRVRAPQRVGLPRP
jgi:VWFA-related protein